MKHKAGVLRIWFLVLLTPLIAGTTATAQMSHTFGSAVVTIESTTSNVNPEGGAMTIQSDLRALADDDVTGIRGNVAFNGSINEKPYSVTCRFEAFRNLEVSDEYYTVAKCVDGGYIYFAPGQVIQPPFEGSVELDTDVALRALLGSPQPAVSDQAVWTLFRGAFVEALRGGEREPFVFERFDKTVDLLVADATQDELLLD